MAFDRRKLSIVNIGGSVETPNIFAYTTRAGAEDSGDYYADWFGAQTGVAAGDRISNASDDKAGDAANADNILAPDYFRGEDEDDLYTKVKFNTGDYIFITAPQCVEGTGSGRTDKNCYQAAAAAAGAKETQTFSMEMFGIEVNTSGNIKLIGGTASGAPGLATASQSGADATA